MPRPTSSRWWSSGASSINVSLRDLQEMFLIRGIEFSYEAVRDWETKLTPSLIDSLRRRRKGRIGKSWYVDETYIKVNGHWCYLYRAIDRFGALVDVRLSEKRDMEATKAFFPIRQSGDQRHPPHMSRRMVMTVTHARSGPNWTKA